MNTIEIPSEFLPLPEPTAGHHWESRGLGWYPGVVRKYATWDAILGEWNCFERLPQGYAHVFYVEAVPNADQREEVDRIGKALYFSEGDREQLRREKEIIQCENRELREALCNAHETLIRHIPEGHGSHPNPEYEVVDLIENVLAKHGKGAG